MKTYSREVFLKARQAWIDGEFGREWTPLRIAAGERGFLYPPSGSPHDDRDAERPSQRAIIYRALQDNPRQTTAIVWRCSSWKEVVDRIIGLEERIRVQADEAEQDAEAERREAPRHDEAVSSLKSILRDIA